MTTVSLAGPRPSGGEDRLLTPPASGADDVFDDLDARDERVEAILAALDIIGPIDMAFAATAPLRHIVWLARRTLPDGGMPP